MRAVSEDTHTPSRTHCLIDGNLIAPWRESYRSSRMRTYSMLREKSLGRLIIGLGDEQRHEAAFLALPDDSPNK